MCAANIDPKRNEIKCVEEQAMWKHTEERTAVLEQGKILKGENS